MLPPFDDTGCLPPGVHPAPLSEVEERCGCGSEIRRVQMESVHSMLDLAVHAGAERVILNGSFVTDIIEPNDVDCVLLFARRSVRGRDAFRELQKGLPFLDIAITDPEDFDEFVNVTFAADRTGAPKGMIEVIL